MNEKELADYKAVTLTRDDAHPGWDAAAHAQLRRGTQVPGLCWVPGTRMVAGIGQPPICPHAAGIDITDIGPCPLDDEHPAAAEVKADDHDAPGATQPGA